MCWQALVRQTCFGQTTQPCGAAGAPCHASYNEHLLRACTAVGGCHGQQPAEDGADSAEPECQMSGTGLRAFELLTAASHPTAKGIEQLLDGQSCLCWSVRQLLSVPRRSRKPLRIAIARPGPHLVRCELCLSAMPDARCAAASIGSARAPSRVQMRDGCALHSCPSEVCNLLVGVRLCDVSASQYSTVMHCRWKMRHLVDTGRALIIGRCKCDMAYLPMASLKASRYLCCSHLYAR